jgi:signal recognition particle subunit SRP54
MQVDQELMKEIGRVKDAVSPDEVLLVADAMTGQNAVEIAKSFDDTLNLTGIILSKFDSDARGGAALSFKSVVGKPVKFIGVGEKNRSARTLSSRQDRIPHSRHGGCGIPC